MIDPDHRIKHEIGMDDVKKFTHVVPVNFKSDFGIAKRAFRTVPYEAWKLNTTTKQLIAADRHRVIREDGSCAWLEDLEAGDKLQTDMGIEEVVSCVPLGFKTHMFCLEVQTDDINDPMNHKFYSDGILSHNTTTASSYLLWKAMFEENSKILIVANKLTSALEVMDRIRYAYEECPDFIKAGIKVYNKTSITFDNGSRIEAVATTSDAGRGKSITLLYCLGGENMVTIRNKHTGEIQEISLEDLYTKMN